MRGEDVMPQFNGIEKRLEKLAECLSKLEPLKSRSLEEFSEDAYLRDIVERNLEVAAQCCIDIANRMISFEGMEKPSDYYGALIQLGTSGILPLEFARHLAPIAGFRNILVHGYLEIDWNLVHSNLQSLDDLYKFAEFVKAWLNAREQVGRQEG